MTLNPNFFDYEKNLTKLLNSPNRIEVYKIPRKSSIRKRSEDIYNNYKYDFEKGQLNLINKNKINQKVDSLSLYTERKRGFSQKIKRKEETELIISNIDPNDDVSDFQPIVTKRQVQFLQRTPVLKPRKSILFMNSTKRSTNSRYKKKKSVTFKTKFVNIIEVESYKQYNVNKLLYGTNDAKCSCFIY